MRVSDAGARSRETPGGARSRRFGDAMRRAREGGAAAGEAGARTASSRRVSADAKDAALAGRRGGFRDEERAATAGGIIHAPGQGTAIAPSEPSGAAELRAVLRALPVAIDVSRVREGAPLSLALGRALEVDLRAAPAGVEVVLRPDPRLARAAEAELPALVASLRARGIAVARAEVRARGGARADRAAR